MAHSTPKKATLSQGRMYSAAVRNPVGHKSNAELEAEMVKTDVDPAVMVKFILLKDLQPAQLANVIISLGLPARSIKTMFAVDVGRITVQMTSQQYADDVKAKYRNNLNNCQASLRLVEAEETKFVSVSRVFGDYSDEKVKQLVFGGYAAKVVSVHYERFKTSDGELLWFTGRRFYNLLKVDHDNLPELEPYVELGKGYRSYVRVQGRKRQCLRCKSEGHLIADCPEEDRREKILKEDDEEGKRDGDDEEDGRKSDGETDDDVSEFSNITVDEDDTQHESTTEETTYQSNVIRASNTSNPAWSDPTFRQALKKNFVPRINNVKRKFPTTPVRTPLHWKTAIANMSAKERKQSSKLAKLAENDELTPEMIRKEHRTLGLVLQSPNLMNLTDDPLAEPFDYRDIFQPQPIYIPDSNSLNNKFNETY